MTTLTTKTWLEDGKIMEQNIPETENYNRYGDCDWHYNLGYEDGWNSAREERREWVGLTDEEVRECYAHVEGVTVSEAVILMSVVRTTQAKLKEKSNENISNP